MTVKEDKRQKAKDKSGKIQDKRQSSFAKATEDKESKKSKRSGDPA